jgi:SPX domain protein involved in polyphosphate accumulation
MLKNIEKGLRQEIKFVLPAGDRDRALSWIRHSQECFFKEYPERKINNIYFDTYDHDAYWENLSGISSRKKTRYRWYGASLYPVAGAMELKYKRNQLNWKDIYKIDEIVFKKNASWHSIRCELISHLPPELSRHLHGNPMPAIVNRYQRIYFRSRENNIRITLDNKICFYKQGRAYPNFTGRASLLDNIILEVKFPVDLKNQVSAIMRNFPFTVSRCSKYCTGVSLVS